ncbi:MAG: NYN domain-containing protein [Rhizobiales bacterium]|nr:NYN domain-containing protein [Hyphomicrobiales bacterium]
MPDPRQRLALFIDGAYLASAAAALGFETDFKRLLQAFRLQGTMVRAAYYSASDDQPRAPLRPLLDWLAYNGYTVFGRKIRSYPGPDGVRKKLPRIELEIVIHAMDLSPRIDHMILFSANGDFRRLVAAVQRRGVRVTVVSTLHAPTLIVADELRRQADAFVELRDLRSSLERRSGDAVVQGDEGDGKKE